MIGSGGAVHNLRNLKWSQKYGKGAAYAENFEAWLIETLKNKDIDALLECQSHPDFFECHPTLEHFLPFFFTLGASLTGDTTTFLLKGMEYGTISMLTFFLNHENKTH